MQLRSLRWLPAARVDFDERVACRPRQRVGTLSQCVTGLPRPRLSPPAAAAAARSSAAVKAADMGAAAACNRQRAPATLSTADVGAVGTRKRARMSGPDAAIETPGARGKRPMAPTGHDISTVAAA